MEIVFEIINWYKKNYRIMPWRSTNDAYKIWLSEVIMQQTQVVQGTSYYHKFLENYPDIFSLAQASEQEVLKLWQGLGYYSRARNLHKTAKIVCELHNGIFPNDYQTLKKLPGLGDYTCAAILSFAYNLSYPVLDGNVFRFISRLYAIDLPIDEAKNRTVFMNVLNELIKNQNPTLFNNAMMEMGAMVCKFKNPECQNCPVQPNCLAFKNNLIEQLPVKSKKIKQRTRFFNYFYLLSNDGFLLEKRNQKDIWENLYQLPLFETSKEADKIDLQSFVNELFDIKNVDFFQFKEQFEHKLTHQTIKTKVWIIRNESKNLVKDSQYEIVDRDSYKNLPISTLIEKILLSLHNQL